MANCRREAQGGSGGVLPPVPPPPASIAGKPPPPPPLSSRFSSRSTSRGSSRGGSLEPVKPGAASEESPRRTRRRSSINAVEIPLLTAEMEKHENREKELREREAAGQADRNSLEEVGTHASHRLSPRIGSCRGAGACHQRMRLPVFILSHPTRHLPAPPLTHSHTHLVRAACRHWRRWPTLRKSSCRRTMNSRR